MPAAIPIIMGVGIGIQAYGQVRAGKAAKKAGEAQAEVNESEAQLDEYNAAIAGVQADDAITRGRQEEANFRQQVKGIIGSQRAGFAGGNIDVTAGSAVDVQVDAARLGELDALTIRTNAAREAWGYQVSQQDLIKRAAIARKGGTYARAAGREAQTSYNIAAAGTLIGGTGSLLMTKYGYRSEQG